MLMYPLFNLGKVLDLGRLEATEYFDTALFQRFLCFKILFGLPCGGPKLPKSKRKKDRNKQTNKQKTQ